MKKKFLLLALLFCGTAQAQLTLDTYLKLNDAKLTEDQQGTLTAYMNGLTTMLVFSNAEVRAQYGKELFCMPPDLPLTPNGMQTIISGYLDKHPDNKTKWKDFPVELTALRSIEYIYPCNK